MPEQEITDAMVDRAAAVIFEPPGLYFMTPEAIPYAGMRFREVIRRALAAALDESQAAAQATEDSHG